VVVDPDATDTPTDALVDAVVAQGVEAGGHLQSDVSTMALVPRVVDVVDCPVVAAGGIGDGRGLAAVLALGADAGWLGTRFVTTQEARVHERYRRRVVEASETDTASGTPSDGG
jgi:nitronate monooxygenase